MAKRKTTKRKARRVSRAKPIQNLVSTGPIAELAAGSATSYYINAAHLLSMMNRKAFHQVTRDGHLKNYGLEIQAYNMTKFSMKVETAPLSYVTYNAARAWHFARKERYEDAGFNLSDLGYGSRLRFALDATMSDIPQSNAGGDGDTYKMIKPSALDHSIADKGEWDWSDVIITPPASTASTAGVEADDLADSFVLHLCGDHTRGSTGDETIKFSHVGMNQSWVENRRGWAAPSSEEVIQPENPLAFARASDTSSMYLTEEVSDEQKQSPPYSNVDDDDAKSVFATTFVQANLEGQFPNPTTNDNMVVAPGGVAKITITNNHTAAEWPFFDIRVYEID